MKKNEKQLKEDFFNELFVSRVVKYTNPVDGKRVDNVLISTNSSLQNFFEKLYHKHKIKYSLSDFISECQYWSYMAIMKFEIRDDGDWEDMIAGTDKANIGRCITAIKNTVEPEIIRFLADGIKFNTTSINGEVFNTATSVKFSSLDRMIISEDGNEANLMDEISADMSFWTEKHDYMANQFIEWFRENKDRILTKSQLSLLKNLQKVAYGDGTTSAKEIERVTGKKSTLIQSQYLKGIKTRMLKAWEKEKSSYAKTQLQLQVEAEVTLWTELMDIIYMDDELSFQNYKISQWFAQNINNSTVMNLIYDNLVGEDISNVMRAIDKHEIASKTIYKLIDLVEKRLNKLQVMDTSSVKFYKRVIEMGKWTKEAHKEYATYHKEFTQAPCYVYRLNEDGSIGELLRVEPFKIDDKKKTLKMSLNSMGATVKEKQE